MNEKLECELERAMRITRRHGPFAGVNHVFFVMEEYLREGRWPEFAGALKRFGEDPEYAAEYRVLRGELRAYQGVSSAGPLTDSQRRVLEEEARQRDGLMGPYYRPI